MNSGTNYSRQIIFLGFFNSCFFGKPEMCYQWVETTNVSSNAYGDDHTNMSKGKDCQRAISIQRNSQEKMLNVPLSFYETEVDLVPHTLPSQQMERSGSGLLLPEPILLE